MKKGERKLDFLKKVFLIIFIAISLILMTGIAGCPNKEEKEKVIPGLQIEFVKDAPKTTITTEERVPIYADISNGGGVHIGIDKASFYLSGIGENLRGVKDKLTNKKFLDKNAGTERLEFASSASTGLVLEKPFIFPVTLTACYDYETIVQVQACIAEEKSDICDISGEKITESSNSPAPIQVTSFTESLEGNKLVIKFTLDNKGVNPKGIGEIYSINSDCDLIYKKDINEVLNIRKVNVEISAGTGDEDFVCDLQEGVAKISSTGKGEVICTKKLSESVGDYITPFKINLKYKYVDSIGTAITLLPA